MLTLYDKPEATAEANASKRDWIEKLLTRGDARFYDYYSHDDLERYRNYLGSMYDQYKDTDRWSEIESITNSFNPGQRTAWDSFKESFGFGSKYRDNYINAMNGMMAALGQISSTRREEEYNSAAQAADRMRAAGLNPDLQGVEGAGHASEFNEPEFTPMEPTGDAQEAFNIATNIASIFSTAVAAAKSFQGMVESSKDIHGKQLENDEKVRKLAEEYAFSTNLGYGSIQGDKGRNSGVPGYRSAEDMRFILDKRARYLRMSHHDRKVFVQHGLDAFYSLKGQKQRYSDFADRENARIGAGLASGKVASLGERSDDSFDTMALTAEYSFKMERLRTDAENINKVARAHHDTQVVNGLDPSLESAAGNNTNAAKSIAAQSYIETEPDERSSRRAKYKLDKKVSKVTEVFLDKLRRNAENGDPIASFMLMNIASSHLGGTGASDVVGTALDIAGLIK